MSDKRGSVTGGLVLIALGIAFLAMQFFEQVSASAVLLALGAAFLIAHVAYRNYGLLIPACVILGLGGGVLAEELGAGGSAVVVGLGSGFVAVWLIDRVFLKEGPSASWWPLIPGGILLLVGGSSYFGGLYDVFPLVLGASLLALGVFIIFRALRSPGDRA